MKPKPKRNITLSMPNELIQQLKILAAQRDTSISALLIEQAQRIVPTPADRANSLMDLMNNAKDRGIGGKITWTRDEIYDRHEG